MVIYGILIFIIIVLLLIIRSDRQMEEKFRVEYKESIKAREDLIKAYSKLNNSNEGLIALHKKTHLCNDGIIDSYKDEEFNNAVHSI
jgi:hypothetical protein